MNLNGVSSSTEVDTPLSTIPQQEKNLHIPYVPFLQRDFHNTSNIMFTSGKSNLQYDRNRNLDKISKSAEIASVNKTSINKSLSSSLTPSTVMEKNMSTLTVSDLTSETSLFVEEKMKKTNINVQPLLPSKDTFDSKTKTIQSYPDVNRFDKIDDLLFAISNNIEIIKRIFEARNGTSHCQSISNNDDIRKVNNNIKEEEKDEMIMQRILELANNYANLTFKDMLSDLYSKKYTESIPSNILQQLYFIVNIYDGLPKLQCSFKNKERKKNDSFSMEADTSNPRLLSVQDIGNRFKVKIYNCKASNIGEIEIWGKIVVTNNIDKLDKLIEEMTLFYYSTKLEMPTITEGGFYAAYKDGFCYRVKCLQLDSFNAVVLFIDRGDELTLPLTGIYKLHYSFSLLPAQAIKMRLSSLDIFSDCDELLQFLSTTLNEKTVYANAMTSKNQIKSDYWNVQLYFNIYEKTVNIADLAIEEMFKTYLNPNFIINKEEMSNVHISYVDKKKIFVQLRESKSYMYLMKLMRNVIKDHLDNTKFEHNELNLNKDKIYLIQNPVSKAWCRSTILRYMKNKKEIEVLLIDYGTVMHTSIDNFILLEESNSFLAKYPKQAIEVRIKDLSNFSNHAVLEQFRKLMYDSNTLFASFIKKTSENNIPTIQLFKKELDNSLTPINETFLLNHNTEIKSTKTVPVKKLESTTVTTAFLLQSSLLNKLEYSSLSQTCLSAVLDPPRISRKKNDVHVVLAENPSKFVIQLLPNKSELKKLNFVLSCACNSYKGPQLNGKDLKIGQLYAAKFDEYENKWYRVYLLEIRDAETVRVYYCDYGYYKVLDIEKVVPLDHQFHQLPYQAVWAELYGIKPVFDKWTVDDASRFKDLTQLKNFVCIIKNTKGFAHKSNKTLMPITVETVYSLTLIDTNTDEDIYIADLLVEESRALNIQLSTE